MFLQVLFCLLKNYDMITYKQGRIVDDIARRIGKGMYQHKLPSTGELANEFDVNIKTINKAISKLVDKGVVTRKRGQGTFVSADNNDLADTLIETLYVGTTAVGCDHPFFGALWKGILDVLGDTSYRIVVTQLEEHKKKSGIQRVYRDFCKSAGKFLIGTNNEKQIALMKRKKIAFVLLLSRTTIPNVASVYADTKQAVNHATKHILSTGREKIAYIGMTKGDESLADVDKFYGFLEALQEKGKEIDFALIRHTPPFAELGYTSMKEILEKKTPEAVFVSYDHLCPGVYKAIREKDLKIPDDIGVMGCDGIDLYLEPALSTINIPRYEIGRKGADLLLRLIKEPGVRKLPSVVLSAELLLKESL